MERERLAAAAGFGAGVLWFAWEATRRWWSDGTSSDCASAGEFAADALFLAALLAGAVAFLALFRLLDSPARIAAAVCAVASVMHGGGNMIEHCVAEPFFIVYVLGGMALVVGASVLAVMLLVRRPWRLGPIAPVCLFVAAVGGLVLSHDRGGAALMAMGWVAFALTMWVWLPTLHPATRNA